MVLGAGVVEFAGVAVLGLPVGLGEAHVVDVGEGVVPTGGVTGAEVEGVGRGVPAVGVALEGHADGALGVADGVDVVDVCVGDGAPPVLALALGSGVGAAEGWPVTAEVLGRGGAEVRRGDAGDVVGTPAVADGVVGAAVVADELVGATGSATGGRNVPSPAPM